MADFTQLELLEAHAYGCPAKQLDDYKVALDLFESDRDKAINMLNDIAYDYEGETWDMPMWNDKLIDLIMV